MALIDVIPGHLLSLIFFIVPGYYLTTAFFTKKNSIKLAERLIFSIVLSIVFISLIVLYANLVFLIPITTELAYIVAIGLIVISVIVYFVRIRKIPLLKKENKWIVKPLEAVSLNPFK